MGTGEREKNRPTRGHHPTKVGPVGSPSPLEHTRHVRGDLLVPGTYTNGLPHAVKGKSDGRTCRRKNNGLKEQRGLVKKTTTWEI